MGQMRQLFKQEHKETRTNSILPDDLTGIVQDYLNNDGPAYAGASLFFGGRKLLARCAVRWALLGQPEEFKAIITRDPEILSFQVENIVGPHGKMGNGTPYQLLLYTDDRYIRDEEGTTFIEMAERYLTKDEAERQKREWFAGWDEKAHVAGLKDAFDKVAKAFDESKAETEKEITEDKELQFAIQAFKEHLNVAVPNAKKNCVRELWDHAVKFYSSERYSVYGGYNSAKNKEFCVKLFGGMDVKLGWELQVLVHNIYYVIVNKVTVHRADISSYYDISSDGLGATSFMSIFGTKRCVGSGRGSALDIRFSIFCQQANTRAAQAEQRGQPKKRGCLIL